MSDLAARLTERLRRRDEKIAALEACIEELEQGLQVTCEREAATTARYDTRIEALKAHIAKADKLADILQSAIIEHDTADYPPNAENPWTMQEWFSDEDRAALAAYREGSDT